MRVNPLFLTEPSFFRYTAPKGAICMNYTIKKVSEMTGLSMSAQDTAGTDVSTAAPIQMLATNFFVF